MGESFNLYGSTKFETLSSREVNTLFENHSKESLDCIFKGSMALVSYVVNKKFYAYEDKEELFQVGCMGLWKAILNFDVSFENEFSTYAVPVIEREIRNHIRVFNSIVKVSAGTKALSLKINKLQNEYSSKNGSLLSPEKLSELLQVPLENVIDAIKCGIPCVSTDEKISNDSSENEETYYKDIIKDDNGDVSAEVEYKETLDILKDMINELSDRDREMLKHLYGIGYVRKTQQETADILNISRALVSRIHINFKRKFLKVIGYKPEQLEEKTPKVQGAKKDLGIMTIYEVLSKYDKDRIDEVISLLDLEKQKRLLSLYPKVRGEADLSLTSSDKVKAKAVLKELSYNLALLEVGADYELGAKSKKNYIKANKDNMIQTGLDEEMKNMETSGKKNDTLINELMGLFKDKTEEQVLEALSLLKPNNKRIMELRFGLNGCSVTSNEEIAEMFSISVNQVYSIVFYAKNRLRKILENDNSRYKLQNEQKYTGNRAQEIDKIKKQFPGSSVEQLLLASSKLSPRQREIFMLSYGLKDGAPLTNKQIMETLNLSEKNVYQQLYIAKKRVKEFLTDNEKRPSNNLDISGPNENDTSFNNASVHINKVIEMIRSGTYDFDKPFRNGNILIKIETTVGDCFLAAIDDEKTKLNIEKGISKKCYIYRIMAFDKDGNIVNQVILLKDKRMKKFYNVIRTDKNGKYIFNNVLANEIVCYDIKNENKIETGKTNANENHRISLDELIQNIYNEAIELLDKRDFVSAEEKFNKLLRMSNDKHICYKANMYLGRIYKGKKKFVVAEKYFKDALALEQDYFTMVQLGMVLSLQGKNDEAIYYFDMSDKICGAKSNHLIEKAKTLKMMGQVQTAIDILDDIISHNERYYWARIEKAKILYEQNNFNDALYELKKCNEIKPNYNNHMVIMGKIQYLTGNKDEAISIFNNCVDKDVKDGVMFSIVEIGYFFHKMNLEELAYYYYNKTSMFPKWINLTTAEINNHFKKHMSNANQEKMHNVLNVDISLDKLNEFVGKMDKTGTRQLYDVYQIHWTKVGYIKIDDYKRIQEDYLTILTLPFTKRIMLCYPDSRFDGEILNEPVEISSLTNKDEDDMKTEKRGKLGHHEVTIASTNEQGAGNALDVARINDDKRTSETSRKYSDSDGDITPVYVDAENAEVTLTPKEINVPLFDNLDEHKEIFRTLINLLSNPTEQVVLLLSLGYVQDRKYSNDEISSLLGVKTEEINNIIERGLTNIMGISAVTINGVESARKSLKSKPY